MSVVSSVLLRRLRTVYVDQAGPRPGDPSTAEGLTALEAELLDRGFAPTAELRAALAWLGPAGLADAGRGLLSRLDAELGADRPHMPLFRSFPASVPDDTAALYVDRVLTLLLQWPNQPCVLCGTAGSVHAVAPCAHLVCGICWDGAVYTGCPICHRRIDPEDPFLTPPAAAGRAAASGNAGAEGEAGVDLPGDRRVFFPRGRVTHAWTADDRRAPLPRTLSAEVCRLLENEVLRRLGTAPRFDVAVLDAALSGLAVPSAEGAAAKALVAVPRGSNQPLPRGEVLRMFLHWTQPAGTRVDLDLSVALFDADWTYVGLCDFTRLVHGRRSVVHSGDLTSAPAPRGASEYADMDLAALADEGVRFAMPIVLSYNNVPFEQLLDAFAGFMALPSREGRDAVYDPRTVRQRYDLVGDSQVHVPMLVDLEHRTFLWTDLHLPASDGFQSVGSHSGELARVGKDLHQYFTAGRTTLWDLAVWHAAARTDAVHVLRRGDGGPDEVWGYERRPAEPVEAFADRIRRSGAPDRRSAGEDGPRTAGAVADGRRAFLALLDGDVVPDGASGTVYRLLPGPVDGCGLEQAAAGDLVALLG